MMVGGRVVAAVAVAAAVMGCNSILGIEEVSPSAGNGNSPDAAAPMADAAVDAAIDAPPMTDLLGWPVEFSGQQDLLSDFDHARAIDLTEDVELIALGVISKAPGGMIRMALFDDTGNDEPRAPVARSAIVENTGGMVLLPVTEIPLTPQRYWIGIAVNQSMPVGSTTTESAQNCVAARSFDQALPVAGFGMSTCSRVDAVNLFIEVRR